jgi:hypothetical protein
MELHASVGEFIEVDSVQVGQPRRRGEVVEVVGEGDRLRYRIRWNDGHESTFYPGSTAHVVHRHEPAG